MTLPIDGMSWIRMISVATTPPEYQVYANRVIGLKSADLNGMGSGADNPGTLLGVKGYPTAPGGQETLPAVTVWFIMTKLDAVTTAALTNARVWLKPANLVAIKAAAQTLIDSGTAPADARTAILAVIVAVVSDLT